MASYHEFNASFGSYTNPYYRPSFGSRLAGGLVRLILLVGVPAGVLLALYRNDVLFDGAKQLGRESDFLRLERDWFGGPAWGTPRSLQPLLEPTSAQLAEGSAAVGSDRQASGTLAAMPAAVAHPANFASKESPTAAADTAAPAATNTAAANTAAANTAAKTASAAPTAGSVKVVSLDSLPTERRGAAAAPVRSTETTSHSASPSRSATPTRTRSEDEEPVARPSKARSVEPSASRASRRAQEEDAEPQPKKARAQAEPEAKPAKAAKASKAAPPPADDNPLKAAIRRAIASDQ